MTTARSRFVDYAPSSMPVVVGERDVAILTLFQDFPYLSIPYIGELLGYEKQTVIQNASPVIRYPYLRKRLTRLRKDGGYLKCPAESWRAANSRYRPAIYALTAKGKALLRERGLHCASMSPGNDFAHMFGACLVLASFRIGVVQRPSLRYISHEEILDHPACPESTRSAAEPFSIPVRYQHQGRSGPSFVVDTQKEHDWLPFGIGCTLEDGRERKILFPGIEFDRRTEPLETDNTDRASIVRHLLSILALLDGGYRRYFGLPSVYVPIVTIGETRKRSIERLLLKLTGGKGSERVLFKSLPDFASYEAPPAATDHMLSVPWDRAGFAPFDILSQLGAPEFDKRLAQFPNVPNPVRKSS
jgi:hypothetical protein